MIHFSKSDIENFDKLYRINMINSCSGFKSANLIGTKSMDASPNLAVFSSVIHMGSNPPLLGFVIRPTKVERNTYTNIKETGYYTINHVRYEFAEQAHHTSAKYESEVSEFEITGLNEVYRNGFFAPFVGQSPIQIGLKFVEEYDIKANETKLVIGEIMDVFLEAGLMDSDGFINLSKAEIAAITSLDGYSLTSDTVRYGYQRPYSKSKRLSQIKI
jgi:flavin reductase (DIM6/NTAB) family NADH-FMN oxidoreductase RutF